MKKVDLCIEVTYTAGGGIEVDDNVADLLGEYEGRSIDPIHCNDEEQLIYDSVIDGFFSERDVMNWEVEISSVIIK